jgi:hypothetical protein
MPDLDCNFLSFVYCLIDLTNRTRGNGLPFKLVKNFSNIFAEFPFETLKSFVKVVLWGVFPQMYELSCHFFSNDITAVA